MKKMKNSKKPKWEIELEDFKFNDYCHEDTDCHVCSSYYKECSVCERSSDYGASTKKCRHPWKKYEWGKCDCGADKNWNNLVEFIRKLIKK